MCLLRFVLRGNGEFVLGFAGDLPLAGDVFGRRAHMIAVERVPQAVLDHGIDHLEIAHLYPVAQVLAVRGKRHRFLTARRHYARIAAGDLLEPESNCAEARAA